MYISDEESFISLGSSCITEVNIQKYFNSRKGWILDYNLSTLDATIEILERYRDNTLIDILCNPDNYETTIHEFNEKIFKNKVIKGFSLWHEHSLDHIPEKMKHCIENISAIKDNSTFILSNIQYNLIWTLESAGNTINDVYVTEGKYNKISSLVKEIFNSKVAFILRDELAEPELFTKENVFTFEMAKTSGNAEGEWCLGPEERFFEIFEKIRAFK